VIGKLVNLHIYKLDPEIKTRLVAVAEEREMSLNDLTGSILAEKLGCRFIGSGKRGNGSRGGVGLQIPVSESLAKKFRVEAARRNLSSVQLADGIFRGYLDDLDVARAA
jgi:hypothetical protein